MKVSENDLLQGKRLVMVAMSINSPRIQRRILYLESLGLDLTVYAFDRCLYEKSGKLNESQADIRIVGKMTSGLTLKRLFTEVTGFLKIFLRELFRRKDFTYFMGFDSTLIAPLIGIGRHGLLYEISDLRFSTRHKGVLSDLCCKLENRTLRKALGVIITSEGFLEELDKRIPGISAKAVLLENQLPPTVANQLTRPAEPTPVPNRIRIGYIGVIRYLDVMLPFLEAIGQRSDLYEFHIHGDGYEMDKIHAVCRKYSNIFYHGEYRNPEDMEKIHSDLDLGFAVYDNRDYNVRVALPNKLYEHVFFGIPLLVASGTVLAERVAKWGIGYAIDPHSPNFSGAFLDSLTIENLMESKAKCLDVPEDKLIIDMSNLKNVMEKTLMSA